MVYLFSFRYNQFIYLKKMRVLCLMSLNWCRFLHVHVLFETNGVSSIVSCLFQENTSVVRNEFWVKVYHETRRLKIIKLSLVLKLWDEWYNKWIITRGVGTPCFFRMLTTVLSYLKTNFTLKCLQTSLTYISLCQKCLDPSIFIF